MREGRGRKGGSGRQSKSTKTGGGGGFFFKRTNDTGSFIVHSAIKLGGGIFDTPAPRRKAKEIPSQNGRKRGGGRILGGGGGGWLTKRRGKERRKKKSGGESLGESGAEVKGGCGR